MPNTKSAIRTQRKQERRKIVNDRLKRAYKQAIRDLKLDPNEKKLSVVAKTLDKASQKGVIAKNKASRLKSRLARFVQKQVKSDEKTTTTPSKPPRKAK